MCRLLIFLSLLCAVLAGNVIQSDVRYFLTNRRTSLVEIKFGEAFEIDPSKDVKIISHGWMASMQSPWYAETQAAYLRKGESNIISVDWSKHASGFYTTAVDRLSDVGYYVATFVLDISTRYNIPVSKFHLIGHSLGAHLFGYAGKHIFSMRGAKVGRITGLDPAGPSFEGANVNSRLSSTDAEFVDVIHTDGGVLGYMTALGHADFYPNGGTARQKGCELFDIGCSHYRSTNYFYESINNNGFVAVSCPNSSSFRDGSCSGNTRVIMGEGVDRSARGTFYLETGSYFPFAIG